MRWRMGLKTSRGRTDWCLRLGRREGGETGKVVLCRAQRVRRLSETKLDSCEELRDRQ